MQGGRAFKFFLNVHPKHKRSHSFCMVESASSHAAQLSRSAPAVDPLMVTHTFLVSEAILPSAERRAQVIIKKDARHYGMHEGHAKSAGSTRTQSGNRLPSPSLTITSSAGRSDRSHRTDQQLVRSELLSLAASELGIIRPSASSFRKWASS